MASAMLLRGASLIAQLVPMNDSGCLGLVHWDNSEGWNGEGGGFRMGSSLKTLCQPYHLQKAPALLGVWVSTYEFWGVVDMLFIKFFEFTAASEIYSSGGISMHAAQRKGGSGHESGRACWTFSP